jgi:hypothetical protein
MKNLLYISLLALPLLLLPSKAEAWGCCIGPANIDFGFNWHYNFKWGCTCQAGPWYLYWPYEAHFATAAPVGGPCYPNWPAPGAVGGAGAPLPPIGYPSAQPMAPAPSGQPMAPAPSAQPMTPAPPVPPPVGIQPTAYSSQAPAYWYGR